MSSCFFFFSFSISLPFFIFFSCFTSEIVLIQNPWTYSHHPADGAVRVGRSPGLCARCRPQHQHRRSSSFSTSSSPHHLSLASRCFRQSDREEKRERKETRLFCHSAQMVQQHLNLPQVRRATKRGASALLRRSVGS